MKRLFTLALVAGFICLLAFGVSRWTASAANKLPDPKVDETVASAKGQEKAVFAGGCFWGIQGVFEHVKGVTNTAAGYSGGTLKNPTYEEVSTERTGHAESVEVTYDPSQVTYGQLLKIFFSVAHDPTELNFQGPDVGPSYRSAIFFGTPDQQRIAKAYVEQLTDAKLFSHPIVTQIEPLKAFYRAEEYHQHYLDQNPSNPYIMINDLPKVANLKKVYPEMYVKGN